MIRPARRPAPPFSLDMSGSHESPEEFYIYLILVLQIELKFNQ